MVFDMTPKLSALKEADYRAYYDIPNAVDK